MPQGKLNYCHISTRFFPSDDDPMFPAVVKWIGYLWKLSLLRHLAFSLVNPYFQGIIVAVTRRCLFVKNRRIFNA